MRPILDPAEEQHIVWASPDPIPSNQKWPVGPVKWVPQNDGTLVAMAVGSVDGKARREMVATFYPDGKENRVHGPAQSEPMQPPPASTEPIPTHPEAQPVQTEAQPVLVEALPVESQPIDLEKIEEPQPFQTPTFSVTNGAAQKPLPPQTPGEVATLVNGLA